MKNILILIGLSLLLGVVTGAVTATIGCGLVSTFGIIKEALGYTNSVMTVESFYVLVFAPFIGGTVGALCCFGPLFTNSNRNYH